MRRWRRRRDAATVVQKTYRGLLGRRRFDRHVNYYASRIARAWRRKFGEWRHMLRMVNKLQARFRAWRTRAVILRPLIRPLPTRKKAAFFFCAIDRSIPLRTLLLAMSTASYK